MGLQCLSQDIDGTLDERFFAIGDDNFNVLALVQPDGSAADSFLYDPYGRPRFFEDGLELTLPFHDWDILYGGYRFDDETGWYHVDRRVYHPTLGRWLQQDPAGDFDSPNCYQYALSSPSNFTDPTGVISRPPANFVIRNRAA